MNEELPENDNNQFKIRMLKTLALTTAYPSTILALAWFFHWLEEKKILSKLAAATIFFIIISLLLVQIVTNAFFKKDKS